MAATTDIRIRFEPSRIDPKCGQFVVGRVVHPGGPFVFEGPRDNSPLTQVLFPLGIAKLMVAGNVVTVWQKDASDWRTLAPEVGKNLRGVLAQGGPVVDPTEAGAAPDPERDKELATQIARVLEAEVNPGIAGHGGRIVLERVVQGDAYVRMEGGCQGCGAAPLTLKQGVEVMVRKAVPGLGKILDVTDHTAGESPYFQDAQGPQSSPLQILSD